MLARSLNNKEIINKLNEVYEDIKFNIIVFEEHGIGVGMFVDDDYFEEEDIISGESIHEVQEAVRELAREIKNNVNNAEISYNVDLLDGLTKWY